MKKIISGSLLKYTLILLTGLFLGWIFFHPGGEKRHAGEATADTLKPDQGVETIWTCAMHPQIRQDHPGKCPICGMELIPLNGNITSGIDPDAITMTKEAASLANVMTTVVTRKNAVKEIHLYGKVQADERLFQSQTAHVPGRIEKLTVNFTGETVKKGQVLAEIYSPELITAQQELIETVKTKQQQPELYEASRERLSQWKLSEDQINAIEKSGKTITNFSVLSGSSGTVTARKVNNGDYVSRGTVLYEIADLSTVWIQFDAYESDLALLDKGMKVKFTIQALPGEEYSGSISIIDPVIDPTTRVARIRVEVPNRSGKLKPEMFATGTVISESTGKQKGLVIPGSAVLWTGRRSLVYVKQSSTDEPVFRMREIVLGPHLGDSYVVESGLSEGEEIVTNGTFSVDASAQLAGKPSMMNQPGGNAPGHMHSGDTGAGDSAAEKMDAGKDFLINLNRVYDKYTELKNALVESDFEKARQSSQKLHDALSGISIKTLSESARTRWNELSTAIGMSAASVSSSHDLAGQRKAFELLSGEMYETVKTFGLDSRTVYYQFCPMYDNNKGAFWLSEISAIKNPYFGEEMLTCGETHETMKF